MKLRPPRRGSLIRWRRTRCEGASDGGEHAFRSFVWFERLGTKIAQVPGTLDILSCWYVPRGSLVRRREGEGVEQRECTCPATGTTTRSRRAARTGGAQ